MTDDKVSVEFGAQTGELDRGVDHAKEKVGELSPAVEHLEKQFEYVAERIAEAFAIREIAEFAEHLIELGEQALRSSAMLGMTVEQVQELSYAAKLAGTDSESFGQSMVRFERNIAEAQKGAGAAAEAFHNLGISQEELKSSTPTELLYRVADAFHETADGAEKVQYANALGGRSWAQMIPFLDRGSEALKKAGEEAHTTASIMSTEQAESLEQTEQGIQRMHAAWQGTGLTLMNVLGPAVDNIISGFTAAATIIRDSINILRELQVVISGDLVIAYGRLKEAVLNTWTEISAVIDRMIIRWKEVGAIMTAIATGNWSLIGDIVDEANQQLENSTKDAVSELKKHEKAYDDLKNSALKAMGEIIAKQHEMAAPEEEHKPKLKALEGGFGKKDNTERQLAEEDIRFKEQMGKLEIANRKSILDEEVAMGEISKKQEYAQLQKLLDQEYALEAGALQQASQLDGLTVVEKKKIDDQMLLLHQKYLNDKQALTRKSVEEEKKQFDQVFQGIDRAFTQSINGILQGTQTWQQAMGHIFTGILSVFVDMVEKMASKWLEGMLMQAIYGETEATAQIGASAAEAGAAAYASTAAIPVVGPELAPAAAARAYGETMAFEGLASFDVGSWELPNDQVAKVHKGEMIIPQPFADSLRDNGGLGGGGGDTYHIHAVDAQSFVNLLKSNSGTLAKMISQEMRNANPHLTGARF